MTSTPPLRITLAQMDVHHGAPQENLQQAADLCTEAARRGSQLCLLPELWGSGYSLKRAAELASPLGEGLFAEMSALARRHRMALGGSLLEAVGGRVYNTFALYAADGSLLASYRKIHRFKPMKEDRYLEAGAQAVVAETPWGLTGLTVCYDLRFPELYRGYALAGASLVLVVAEWPVPRIAHWRTLLQARAIENQYFVAAVNRVGEEGGQTFGGHSGVLTPWGEYLLEAGTAPALLTVDVPLDEISRICETFPTLPDRRPETYRL